uniref:Putative secreted protein n=1 Tax=Anopheles triannulatus TaxID=58253 RepID=A0A2M4B155_9DIPT
MFFLFFFLSSLSLCINYAVVGDTVGGGGNRARDEEKLETNNNTPRHTGYTPRDDNKQSANWRQRKGKDM